MRIYVDNSATTAVSETSLKAMLPYFRENFGNASAIYSYGQEAKKGLEDSRRIVAKSIGALNNEIYFASGGTESDNWAISHALAVNGRKGRHLVSTAIEHNAVLKPLERLEGSGWKATLIKPDEYGQITPEQLEEAIRPDTVLVSVIMASNVIGTILNIRELCATAHRHGVLFHTDAVQAAGHIPIDVRQLGVDLLSISAHKFQGPKGAGALFSKIPRVPVPLILGGGQEKGARSGTENVPGVVGLSQALTEAVENMDQNSKRLTDLRDQLIASTLRIPGTYLTGHPTNRLPGHASFVIEGLAHGAHLINELNEAGICASSGSACSASSREASGVLSALGLNEQLAMAALRLSLSPENTEEEVETVAKALARLIPKVRDLTKNNRYSH